MARAAGIEITPASIRCVVVENGGRKTRILSHQEVAVTAAVPAPADGVPPPADGNGEAVSDAAASRAIRDLLQKVRLRGVRTAISIDTGEALVREINVPFKNDEQIRKTYKYELESQIHNYAIEDLITDFIKTGETDKGALLLGMAVPRSLIARRIKLFEEAGLEPAHLDLDMTALFGALAAAGEVETDDLLLVLHGAGKYTRIMLVERRRPCTLRTVRFALSEVAGASPFASLEAAAQEAALKPLAREVSRFLMAAAGDKIPAAVLLSGDLAGAGATEKLKEILALPCRDAAIFANIENAPPPAFSTAFGLALKALGQDPLRIDFRQEEFIYRRRFDAVKSALLVTVEMIVVLLALAGLHLYFQHEDLTNDLNLVLGYQRDKFWKEMTNDPPPQEEVFARAGDLRNREKELRGAGESPIPYSAFEIWNRIFQAVEHFKRSCENADLGGEEMFLEIRDLAVTQPISSRSLEVTIHGVIRNREFLDRLEAEIKKDPAFGTAHQEATRPDPGGSGVQFGIKIEEPAKP